MRRQWRLEQSPEATPSYVMLAQILQVRSLAEELLHLLRNLHISRAGKVLDLLLLLDILKSARILHVRR